jgi:integrase/recombinase XerD
MRSEVRAELGEPVVQQQALAPVPVALPGMPNVSGAETDTELVSLWLRGRRSPETRRSYARSAGAFLEHLQGRGCSLRSASVLDLQDFVDAMTGAASSRSSRTAAIKSLLSFGHRTGYLRFNIGAALAAAKAPRAVHERILSPAAIHRMLALESDPRNHALLRLLYASGARCSELANLHWRDVQQRERSGQLTLLGKGDKRRAVLLTEDTWSVLIKLRHEGNGAEGELDADAPVFVSRKGGALTDRQVRSAASGQTSRHQS